MKDQWEQESAALRAEVAALQKQIHAIETKLAGATGDAPTLSRGRMSKSKMMILLPVVVLLAAGGVLYGEGAIDALFIDQRGNVGVGTTTPQGFQVVLPETNKPSVPNAGISLAGGSEGNASIELRNNGKGTPYIDFAQSTDKDFDARIRLTDKDKLAIEGANVGIGTTDAKEKLEVNGRIKDQTGYVMPVGSIVAYHGKAAPEGWLLCDGGAIPEEEKYKDLKALLGKSATPDLRGRTLIGAGQGAQALRSLGDQGGEETHKLTIAEMPKHHHYGFGEHDGGWPFGQEGNQNNRGTKGGLDNDNFYYNTSDTGGDQPFNNMQPYYTVNYIIKY